MAFSTSISGRRSSKVAYLQAYFVTIATILGTGILGLPVTLTQSGLYPFLISFLLDAVMQSVLIHFFVDLLQKACAIQLENQKEEEEPLNKTTEEEIALDSADSGGELVMKEVKMPAVQGRLTHSPNLHLLGKFFLNCSMQLMFDVLIILQFIALLVCYALAGSEAYAQLINISHFYVIPVFVWVLALCIVFALQFIQPVISILTFVKGSVLLATTMVTFYVGMTINKSISNDFGYIGAPFLMGTVALGGTINTMPFTFEKINYEKGEVQKYRLAVHLGLWTCVALNILWCWSVLEIVPQTVIQACEELTSHYQDWMAMANSCALEFGKTCFGELSLESAKFKGEISTLPMTSILERDHANFQWVAVLIQVFIVVSITVSYLTIGSALHHTLTGVVQSALAARNAGFNPKELRHQSSCSRFKILSTLVSLLAFIVVFIVAICDPQGFVDILEKFASLTLNSQAGIFVFLMLLASRKSDSVNIPAPMAAWFHHLIWTIPLFFNAAVLIDIYDTVTDAIYPAQIVPVKMNYSLSCNKSLDL